MILRRSFLRSTGLVALVLLLSPSFGNAQPQTKNQQTCIKSLNKDAAAVAKKQAKAILTCVKDASKAQLPPGQSAQQCLTADAGGKVATAVTKTAKDEVKKCGHCDSGAANAGAACTVDTDCTGGRCQGQLADFGVSSAAAASASGISEQLALARNILGTPIDAAIILDTTSAAGATCQAKVITLLHKLVAAKLKAWLMCKNDGLRATRNAPATIQSRTQLRDICLDPVAIHTAKAQKLVDMLQDGIQTKCLDDGVSLATAFPGTCAGQATTAAGLAGCIDTRGECRVCRMINIVDALDRDCDLFDDGQANRSCGPSTCGDGVLDPGEQCDGAAAAACPGACALDCTCTTSTPTASPVPSLTPTQMETATPTATQAPPSITDFNPKSAPVGTLVTIVGQHLAPSSGGPQVTLNKQGGGTMFAPVASFDVATIRFVIPTGAATGPLTVTVGALSTMSSAVLTIVASSDFTIAALPAAADVIQGESVTFSVTLGSSSGFAQLAALSVAGLPAGVMALFTPPQIAAGQSSLLTVSASTGVAAGTIIPLTVSSAVTVEGIPLAQSAPLTVTVTPRTTSLRGRTVVADALQTTLAGVTITLLGKDGNGNSTGCSGQTVSDAAGNFAFTNLPTACTGAQLIRYDGSTVTSPPGDYAGVDLVYDIVSGQVVVAPVLIHLPRIDNADTVMVQQNAAVDQTFRFQSIPNLEVTVYAGTVFTLADGSQPNPFPLIAVSMPVDRLPDEKPSTTNINPFIVAFQPAGTTVSQAVPVSFPNPLNTPPGTNVLLYTLDPSKGVMVQYGTGTISSDGKLIVPDLNGATPGKRFGLVHLGWHGPFIPFIPQLLWPLLNPRPPGCPAAPPTADPVDPTSGIQIISETDIAINGLRGSVAIERTYRSLSSIAGPFGIGSSHNYWYRLDTNTPQTRNLINLVTPNGNPFPFSRGPSGTFANDTIPALRGAVMSVVSLNEVDLRFKDGTIFHFVPNTAVIASELASITDANGNHVSLIRNPARLVQITQIVDPVGRTLTLTYNAADRITSVVDPIGRTVLYTYNAQGTLQTVTDPAGGVTRYDYDAQNRLTGVTDPRNVVVAQNIYDANGRVSEQRQADGGVWRFDYVSINPAVPTSPLLQTTVTDPRNNPTTYRFSPQGYLLDITDALGQTRVFEREEGTNLLLTTRGTASCGACGGSGSGDETFSYDPNGNLLSLTDALGNTTMLTYEPVFNKVTSITDPLGHTTSFTYDASGNLLSVTDATGNTTSLAYDAAGLLASITDALSNVSTLTYDDDGNLATVADPLGNASALTYDAVSRLIAQTDPRGKTTHSTYDNLNRTTQIVDALNGTTQFTYDANGNLLTVIDALSHATTHAYDGMDRLSGRTDPLGGFESFEYDVAGNLIRRTDRKGQLSTYDYDALNRRTGASYVDGAITSFAYDARGRITQASDSIGDDILRSYDPLDRLTEERTSSGTIDYAFDPLGRRASMTVTGQSPVSYDYDANSQLRQITQDGQVVTFAYDALSRRTALTLPNGVTTEYHYDLASRLAELVYRNLSGVLGNLTYQYDTAGNRTAVGGSFARTLIPDPIPSASYDSANRQLQFGARTMTFDANGNLATRTDTSGVTTFTWDARNRLVGLVGASTTGAFTYDVVGRRTSKEINGQLTGYFYDRVDIIEEVADGFAVNLLRSLRVDEPLMRSATEHYLADALGSIIALTDPNGTPQTQYTYEPFGATRVAGAISNPFQFTARENDRTSLYYFRTRYYDPMGQRFIQADPTEHSKGREVYSYVLNNPLKYIDPFGAEPWWAKVLQVLGPFSGHPAPLVECALLVAQDPSLGRDLANANRVLRGEGPSAFGRNPCEEEPGLCS